MFCGFGLSEVTLAELLLERSGSEDALSGVRSEWKGSVEMSGEAALLRRTVRRRGAGLRPVAVEENEGKSFCVFCFN